MKSGFFTLEILIATLLLCLTADILFSYIGRIQIMKSAAEQLCEMSNLASACLEQKQSLEKNNLKAILEISNVPNSKLKKYNVNVTNALNREMQLSIWTIYE